MLATQNGRSNPVRISWKRSEKFNVAPEFLWCGHSPQFRLADNEPTQTADYNGSAWITREASGVGGSFFCLRDNHFRRTTKHAIPRTTAAPSALTSASVE